MAGKIVAGSVIALLAIMAPGPVAAIVVGVVLLVGFCRLMEKLIGKG